MRERERYEELAKKLADLGADPDIEKFFCATCEKKYDDDGLYVFDAAGRNMCRECWLENIPPDDIENPTEEMIFAVLEDVDQATKDVDAMQAWLEGKR